MNRLDSVKSPLLSESVLQNLFSKKIFTVQKFLEEKPDRIASISSLQIKDVITLRESLITQFSAFVKKGVDEFLDLKDNSVELESGIECLDNLLGEVLRTGNIIEICGLTGSGKTQLCLTIGVNNSLRRNIIVHFIDTSLGNFTGDRIENILENKKLTKETIKDAMNRIKITKVRTMDELVSTLHQLKTSLGNQETCCRLIIIDSLSGVYLPMLNEADNDGSCFMNHIASLMRFISKQFHLLFLVVNLATKVFDPEACLEHSDEAPVEPNTPFKDLRPLLGRYWLHVPSTRLLIHRIDDRNLHDTTRTISVLKSSSIPIFSSCSVTIAKEGIVQSETND
ncbi:unnamed protein product [Bemisia tabaci]|uniref:RecA family profile 1 domain-containing protein n=1 Tax=Bemisia tabaci TaxID=7038 RepID=A0A9P0A147_BEMTA|nr:unnamed protein product [Bemisia tabaci]